ncbi:MAG: hypothetical protein PHG89_03730 [Gallionella sp.]|nr:hypothetical protein [Gallionella sp.]
MSDSLFSYQQGLSQGNTESIVAIRERNDAVGRANEWKNFSDKLQDKLDKAELDFVKAESGRIGFAHLFRVVAEELKRVDPNNPLLQKENQLRIVETKVAEKVTEMGYVYDTESGQVVGKR